MCRYDERASLEGLGRLRTPKLVARWSRAGRALVAHPEVVAWPSHHRGPVDGGKQILETSTTHQRQSMCNTKHKRKHEAKRAARGCVSLQFTWH